MVLDAPQVRFAENHHSKAGPFRAADGQLDE
jgi:hypothetical protein